MPAILTHYTFAKIIYPEESPNSSLVYLGSQGPDVFFFYGYLNKKHKNAKEIRHFGHHLHNIDIAPIYNAMFEYAKKQNDHDKELLLCYIRGMMYHYCLDRNTHAFIFYRTGAIEEEDNKNPGYYMRAHVFYESNLDVLLANHYSTKTKNINCIKTDEEQVKLVSKMYNAINNELFRYDYIDDNTFYYSYLDMLTIQKLFYSPTGIKRSLFFPLRKKIQVWVQTNPCKPYHDQEIDYLNINKCVWKMPDTGEEKDDSFFGLIEKAKDDAFKVNEIIELTKTNDVSNELTNFTNNVSHDGTIVNKSKIYFDFCYNVLKKVPF